MKRGLTSRVARGRLLAVLCAGACLAALPAAPAARAASIVQGAWSFPSAPSLNPPAIEFPAAQPGASAGSTDSAGASVGQSAAGLAPGYVLIAPIRAYSVALPFEGKPGPEILESDGSPIWQDPLGSIVTVGGHPRQIVAMDLHTDTYEGKRVLIWWQGYITPQGFGNGSWIIVNQRYQTLATISAPPGYELDFHDIALRPNGTAYVLASKVVKLNLHCCGGAANGFLYDQVVLQVNIQTGKILWSWDPLNHVPLKESYAKAPTTKGIWDPYHLNSISFGPSGNLIVSARNTWAAYWINRVKAPYEGKVFATLGGKMSSFTLGEGAHFAWQHDVLQESGQHVSIFDDEAAPAEATQSRGLVLALDFAHHTASVVHEYLLPAPKLAGSQGNVEFEGNGNVFVGWGQLPYFSEYSASGQLLYEGNLPASDESYRTFRSSWIGLPLGRPSAVVQSATGGVQVLASWNGATQIVSWKLLAGSSPTTLSVVADVRREGFETSITTTNAGPYYAVQAVDRAGRALGSSLPVTVGASASRLSGVHR